MSSQRLGLALGSGSARGSAHIGVMHALAERGLRPSVVAGASVGSLVSAAYASGQLQALENWVCTLTQLDVWRLVDTTFLGGGLMSGNRLMTAISERIGDTDIEDLPVAFGAVAADLYTGEEVWLRAGPMMQAVRASSGLPGLFTPHWDEGRGRGRREPGAGVAVQGARRRPRDCRRPEPAGDLERDGAPPGVPAGETATW